MPRSLPTPARLEAFSDGVIAVIITIMVLELKVPHTDGLAGLRTLLPVLAVYALSYTFTGIYWVNHGHLVDRLRHADTPVLWGNLLFLFTLSLLPFFTGYVVEKHMDTFSVQLYALALLFTAFGFQSLSAAVLRHNNRRAGQEANLESEDPRQHRSELRKGWLSASLYVVALVAAHWHPALAMGVMAAVTLVWIVPGLGTDPESCPGGSPR